MLQISEEQKCNSVIKPEDLEYWTKSMKLVFVKHQKWAMNRGTEKRLLFPLVLTLVRRTYQKVYFSRGLL